jgi:thiol-disulfide isomerase/thioredoxin
MPLVVEAAPPAPVEAAAQALAAGDIVLLDFAASWCGPCRSMAPLIGEIATAGWPVRHVDVDQEGDLVKRFGITGGPCYILLVKGHEVGRIAGATTRDELEKLLQDPDPRARRAALDGMINYNYWFGIGDNPIPAEKFTPAMVKSIIKMLSDPKESWWVVDGALLALKFAPAKYIQQNYKLIEPWTKHSDWWLREAAFMALSGLEKDDDLYVKILPTLLKIATSEYHTMPRERMMNHLNGVLQEKKPESKAKEEKVSFHHCIAYDIYAYACMHHTCIFMYNHLNALG